MNEFEQKLSEIIRARCQGHLPSVGAEQFLHNAAQELIGCLEKEYTSEDLEVELRYYLNSDEYINSIGTSGLLMIARHFANWQRKKDEAEIDRDYKTADKVQYRNGWKDCHDTMMKDAVNATLSGCWSDLIGWATFDKPLVISESEFNMGDKVKILIIKKDGTVSNPPLK